MKIDKRDPRHWLLLLRQGLYTLLAICARHLSRRPRKPVVILYGHQLSGNLRALYEEWRRTRTADFDCYFLSLDPVYGPELRAAGIQVLLCGSLRDMLLVGRASAIITDHGLHAMSPLIRFTNILFIDVWHGIPFKGFVPDDFRVQHRYDEVWVSSSLLRDIYVDKFGFPPHIVHPLGYARADKLFRGEEPDPALREQAGILAGNRVVLYAPTWQQDDRGRELFPFGESQDAFIERLSEICRTHRATLVIRSHLNASIDSRTYDNVRYCSMKEFPDAEGLLMLADILICDWSSIAFDFLALNRPTIFLDVEPPFKNGFSLGREYRFGKIAHNLDSLETLVDVVLATPQAYAAGQATIHHAITRKVYDENTDGKVAAHQLARLVGMIE